MPDTESFLFAALIYPTNGTGEFWLDDVVIQPAVTPILGSVDTSAWRQEVYDEEEDIEIYVSTLINDTVDKDHLKLTVDVVNSEGHVVDTLKKFELGFREESRVATFIYDASKLKQGFYKLRATSINEVFDNNKETVETNLHRLEKKRDKTFYVDQKTMVANDNGKPFFPLGLYISKITDTEIDLITDSPFNLLISYAQLVKKQLDHIYERSGGKIRVINNLAVLEECFTEQKDLDEMHRLTVARINAWRESKGLFGYYITDEPAECEAPLMRNVTLTVREMDPKHVTYTAVNRTNLTDVFKEGFDVIGIDVYPLQYKGALHSIYRRTTDARQRMCSARPMWNIPQIFDWEVYASLVGNRPPYTKINISNERPPTEQQLRQMTYQFIAAGGMGFIYYRFDDLKAMDHKSPFEKEWAKVKKVVKELADKYVPIIISGIPGTPRFTLPFHNYSYIGRRTFYYDRYSYFLIVNNVNVSQNYSFYKPDDISESDITMIMGSSNMTFENNTITLEMPSTEVVWLRVLDRKWMPDHLPTYAIVLITLAVSIPVVGGLMIFGICYENKKH